MKSKEFVEGARAMIYALTEYMPYAHLAAQSGRYDATREELENAVLDLAYCDLQNFVTTGLDISFRVDKDKNGMKRVIAYFND